MKAPPLVHVIKSKRRLAVLATEEIDNLFAHEPKIDVEGFPYRVVHHGQYETALLQRLGYPVSNPMREYYAFPRPPGKEPFETQKVTCDLMTLNPRAYVLNDMGTGKTWSALWAWDWLKENGLTNKLLVVAPLSTLRFTWLHDIYATIRHRKAVVLHGDKTQRLKLLETPDADIFIINHDGIKVIYDELKANADIDAIVIDELAVFRNGGRKGSRFERMLKLTQGKKFVWGMTGSPMPQAPTDVWAQCSIVTPASVPKYFSHVREQLMIKKSTHKWVAKEDALENALKYMQPAVRFSLDDVTELPPLIERFIDVDMTDEQKKVYQGIVRVCQAMVEEKQINAVNAAVAMGKLLQIAGGWVYTGDREVANVDNEPRMRTLVDLIMGSARPVICFAPYHHALLGISKVFETAGITHRVVHGQTQHREDIYSDFQNRGLFKVLLAHPKTMAHGLNLQSASTIIWFLPVTSLETYEQANARIRRVGQLHKQEIIHLVSSPVERRVYNLLRGKQTVQDKFLALLASNTLALGAAA